MLKVKIESLMLLHLYIIEGLLWDKGLMKVLILVHVILRLLLVILIVLIVMMFRYSYDLRLSHFFFSIVFIIEVLALFFTGLNNLLDCLVFMDVLVYSVIFIIMALINLVTSLKSLDQVIVLVLVLLWLWVAC
jgi:hypothetical protein